MGIVGDSLNGLTDAIRRQGENRVDTCAPRGGRGLRGRRRGAFDGELAVCAGSCGPGNLHLINGLFDCQRSRVPVLAIAAQVPSAELGAGYFQETHPESPVQGMQRLLRADLGREPDATRSGDRNPAGGGQSRCLGRGHSRRRRTSGRNGRAAAEGRGPAAQPAVALPARADIERLAALLNSDGRVTLLCGSGCQGAHDQLLALADRLKAPIVSCIPRQGACRVGQPFDVGMTGLIGFSSGYYAMFDCDILLMLGTDFPYRQFYPRGAGVRVAQVDVRPGQIGRPHAGRSRRGRRCFAQRSRVSCRSSGRSVMVPTSLVPRSITARRARNSTNSRSASPAASRSTRSRLPRRSAIKPRRGCGLHLRCRSSDGVGRALSGDERQAPADRVVLARLDGQRDAACDRCADRVSGRQVISLSGDGGFSMLMGDFLSLAQLGLAVKVVGVQTIPRWVSSRSSRNPPVFSTTGPASRIPISPRLAEAARACAGSGSRIPPMSTRASPPRSPTTGRCLVDAVVSRTVLPIPPAITAEMAKGFTLYMVKAVFSGRGDDLVDLARSNLWS